MHLIKCILPFHTTNVVLVLAWYKFVVVGGNSIHDLFTVALTHPIKSEQYDKTWVPVELFRLI